MVAAVLAGGCCCGVAQPTAPRAALVPLERALQWSVQFTFNGVTGLWHPVRLQALLRACNLRRHRFPHPLVSSPETNYWSEMVGGCANSSWGKPQQEKIDHSHSMQRLKLLGDPEQGNPNRREIRQMGRAAGGLLAHLRPCSRHMAAPDGA
jgi:hypothetical protein